MRAFANVQGGVNFAQAAKNVLTGQAGNSSEPNPAPVATKKHTTLSAAGTSVSPNAATVVSGPPIAGPTTLQTVTQPTTTVTHTAGGAGKQVVSEYQPSIRLFLIFLALTHKRLLLLKLLQHLLSFPPRDPALLEPSIVWGDNLHNAWTDNSF